MVNLSSEPPFAKLLSPPAPPVLDPARVEKILLIRPRFAGDLCLTLPVVDALRRAAPKARIDYLAEEPYAVLLEGDPRLTRVIAFRRDASTGATARLLSGLTRTGYDLVLDLFCNPRTALWTAATAARVRVGYRGKGWRSSLYNVHPRHEGKNAVRFHLASVAALGWPVDLDSVPRLGIDKGEKAMARARLSALGVSRAPETPLLVLHPGARWPTRRWAPDRFAGLARRAVEQYPELWALILGGPGEEETVRDIATAAGERSVAVTGLDLREMAALLSLCAAFVGGDSGPVHVAAAVGTPSVGIFGRNEPERFFPYPPRLGHRAVYSSVWCSPCHLDVCPHTSCLRAITVDWVWQALSEILGRAPVRVGS